MNEKNFFEKKKKNFDIYLLSNKNGWSKITNG